MKAEDAAAAGAVVLDALEAAAEPAEAEAWRLAAEEGLSLVQADNIAGFKGVSPNASGKLFMAQIRQGGKRHCLGTVLGP